MIFCDLICLDYGFYKKKVIPMGQEIEQQQVFLHISKVEEEYP